MDTTLVGAQHWQDHFTRCGLGKFEDFWQIEGQASKYGMELKRAHLNGEEVLRCTVRLVVGGVECFLKRGCGQSKWTIDNELRAATFLPTIGIGAPEVLLSGESDGQAFVVFGKMRGESLYDLEQLEGDDPLRQRFESRRKEIDVAWAKAWVRMRDSGWYYADWFKRHMYVELEAGGAEIHLGMIDLERMFPVKEEWRGRFILGRWYLRRRELRKIGKALNLEVAKVRQLSQG